MGELIEVDFERRKKLGMRNREEEYDVLFDTALDMVRNSSEADDGGKSFLRAVGALIFEIARMAQAEEATEMTIHRAIEVCEGWHEFTNID